MRSGGNSRSAWQIFKEQPMEIIGGTVLFGTLMAIVILGLYAMGAEIEAAKALASRV